jgi:SnoaL-like domain
VNAIEVARNHFNSWNRHDADAIVGAFVEGGTYNNPNVDQPLTGAAIGAFAKSVFAAFPDMSLEVISIGDTGGGLVALQWVLRGTSNGKLGGRYSGYRSQGHASGSELRSGRGG